MILSWCVLCFLQEAQLFEMGFIFKHDILTQKKNYVFISVCLCHVLKRIVIFQMLDSFQRCSFFRLVCVFFILDDST